MKVEHAVCWLVAQDGSLRLRLSSTLNLHFEWLLLRGSKDRNGPIGIIHTQRKHQSTDAPRIHTKSAVSKFKIL